MSRCTCTGIRVGKHPEVVDVACPTHGLPDGAVFPPMDRHAKLVCRDGTLRSDRCETCHGLCRRETAAATQRRLYDAARHV